MEKISEEMKKDVNKYIRQSKKLDGNKTFKKTYVSDERISFMLELNGSEMKIYMLLMGNTLGKTTIGDISNFDSTWDSFIQETDRFINKMLEVYRESFNEKMDEFIEMDELFEPFIVKNKKNHNFDVKIDLKTQLGFDTFAALFDYFNDIDLYDLYKDFILPHLDAFNEGMSKYGTIILTNKDDKRDIVTFDPTSRLGRLIIHIAMENKKEN